MTWTEATTAIQTGIGELSTADLETLTADIEALTESLKIRN
jgi:hypothetical protein